MFMVEIITFFETDGLHIWLMRLTATNTLMRVNTKRPGFGTKNNTDWNYLA